MFFCVGQGREARASLALNTQTRHNQRTLILPSILLLPAVLASQPAPTIIDRPIRFGAKRRALALAYRRAHESPSADSIRIEPKVIVLHHTAFSTFKKTWNYFNRVKIDRGRRKVSRAGQVNVSAHFVVDRDGTIYRLMPETRMARHTIGLNHISIGIENVGDLKKHPLTQAQVRANIELVRALAKRFPITHVIGHHEYRRMEGHPYFRERDRKYRTTKVDPGPAFMRRVRAGLAGTGLLGPPVRR